MENSANPVASPTLKGARRKVVSCCWRVLAVISASSAGVFLVLNRHDTTLFHMRRGSIMTAFFGGRHNIWWGSRVTLVASHIVLDVSCVATIKRIISL